MKNDFSRAGKPRVSLRPLAVLMSAVWAALWLSATAPTALAQGNVTVNTLHSFTSGSGGDGTSPTSLVLSADGSFYGVTTAGGTNGYGTFFRLTADGGFTNLGAFATPVGKIIQSSVDGNFYGFTSKSGSSDQNAFVQLTPAGVLTTLCTVSGANNLIEGSDGDFYVTTTFGGEFQGGIYKVSRTGTILSQESVTGDTDAGFPSVPGLIQNVDGTIYFATATPFDDPGAVQQLTAGGALSTLYTFSAVNGYGINGDGSEPTGLILGNDGNLYGTTAKGGKNGFGTFFVLTPAGALTNLHDNAAAESGDVLRLQAADGTFYGTSASTIFSFTPAGGPVTLHTFSYASVNGNVTSTAPTSLIQGAGGNFYGTGAEGGDNGVGSVFEFNPAINPGSLGFAAATYTVDENAGSVSLTVQRTRGSAGAVSVTCKASNGTAVAGTDYQATTATLIWADGDATDKTVTLPILDRGLGDGGTRTFVVTISDATGGAVVGATASASVEIVDNDLLPVITLTASTPAVTLSGGLGVFTLTLSAPQPNDLIVSYAIKGSAVNGTDYAMIKTFKKIKAGKTSKAIKILPQGDLGGAGKATVVLVLQPGADYTVGTTGKVKMKIVAGD